jgi:dUTP pyrophosphatase
MKCDVPPLKIKKLFPDAKLPVRANPTDSGLDVYAFQFELLYTSFPLFKEPFSDLKNQTSVMLKSLDRVLINTGLALTVGPGWEVQVRPRSGNALKRGLTIANTPGTVDASYRGFLGIIIINLDHEPQEINLGEKIAQIVVCPVCLSEVQEVKDLDDTARGAGGFGSTGQYERT